MYRSIQRRTSNKIEMNAKINKHCDEMLRMYGKKEPMVHERGYYKSRE